MEVSRDSSGKRKLPADWLPSCTCTNPFKFIPADVSFPLLAKQTALCHSCKCAIDHLKDDFYYCDMATHQGDHCYLCLTCACKRKKVRCVISPDLSIRFKKGDVRQHESSHPVPALEYVEEMPWASSLKPTKKEVAKSLPRKKVKICYRQVLPSIPGEEKQSSSTENCTIISPMRKTLEEPSEKKTRNSDATIEITTGEKFGTSLSLTAESEVGTLFCNTDLEENL